MGTRSITLQTSASGAAPGIEGVRWRIEATAAVGMPTAVFLFLRVATVQYDPCAGATEPPVATAWAGEFAGVASAADLEDYPEGAPLVDGVPPFYRLAAVDLVFLSAARAEEARVAVVAAVDRLRRALDFMDNLRDDPPIVLGPGP